MTQQVRKKVLISAGDAVEFQNMIDKNRKAALLSFIKKGGGRIHMLGIGGVGMSGLAFLLKRRGFDVDGCDKMCGPLCHWLVSCGIPVYQEHNVSHTERGYDLVINTPAVGRNDRELAAFRYKGVLEARRGEVLPLMLDGVRSVAVAGTHGKTTTSTFIAHILKHCGSSTGWCIGGSASSPGGVAGMPDNCDVLVVEADESDGTLRGYHCDIAVITNVEYDHMEHFESPADFESCFSEFAGNAVRRVVYCADDSVATRIGRSVKKGVSYGFSQDADLRISGMKLSPQGCEFDVSGLGLDCERVVLSVPGRHNVLNAAASIIAVLEFGADIDAIKEALAAAVLPDRRYQEVVGGDVSVISDYAHHPTEIRALLDTAGIAGKTASRAVFQPHRYTRTKSLLGDFPAAFSGVGELVLVPVYAASEAPLAGGAIHDLYRAVRMAGTVEKLLYARSLAEAWAYYSRSLNNGDRLLVIGAGDVENIGYWLKRDYVEKRQAGVRALYDKLPELCGREAVEYDFPLGKRTTIGCGGNADVFARIGSAGVLRDVLGFCCRNGLRVHLFAGGSNILVSDLGVRGVTVHLEGSEFERIHIDGVSVRAGAAVKVSRLMDALEEAGLSGLEFLDGIPGMVGGVVKMNAGAFGGEVGNVLKRVRCISSDGGELDISGEGIIHSYRSMKCLDARIVMEAVFECRKSGSGTVARRRAEIRERRKWMKGVRSLGSVFRNPADSPAGRIIDQCGLKGFAVGGLSVSTMHANLFVNDGTGTSSDMMCLMDAVSSVVREKTGIVLEREIDILD